MTYVMSDIHGRYDKYLEMLEEIDFGDEDTLYILGDMIDRGPDGLRVLLDAAQRSNVICLIGNHELNAILALPSIIRAMYGTGDPNYSADEMEMLELWLCNGGTPTIEAYMKLSEEEQEQVAGALNDLITYAGLEVNGRRFILVHTGPENFSTSKNMTDYSLDEITFSRPDANTRYFEDATMVFGHTPTPLLFESGGEIPDSYRIFHAETFIDIDCCAAYGGRLGCLCLDTMEEFYV